MSLKIWLPLNGNIENQGTLNTTSRLPSGYTEVKYLRTTGSQHIDTGVIPDADMEIECTYRNRPGSEIADTPLFGSRDSSYDNSYTVWAHPLEYNSNTGVDTFIFNGSQLSFSKGYPIGTWQSIYLSKTQFINNDQKLNLSASAGTPNLSIILCGLRNGNTIDNRKFIGDIIKFSIKKGSSVVRNLIPALRNSDNKPGMYDTVTGTFYTNAGTGEFSVGPAVTCTITNNGATVDNNGKIGKCYSFNGGTITAPAPKITNKITVAAWIKAPDNNSGWRRVCGMQSAAISWQSASALLMLNGTNLYFSISNGSTCTSGGCTFNISDSSNWFHACGTYDGTAARLYVNGVLKKELAITTTIENTPIWLGGTSAGERFTGKLNDFRLYDECLSADQIKEISRGMVLHYKMCQPERAINLIIGGNKLSAGGSGDGSITASNGVLHITSSGSYNSFYCDNNEASGTNLVNNLSVGDKFTVSFDFKSITSNSNPGLFINEGNSYIEMSGFDSSNKNKWQRVYCIRTWAAPGTRYGNLAFHINNVVGEAYIRNIKIEKGENHNPQWSPAPSDNPNWGTIEYDGSGFKNHGTVSGNVTLSADSPRYTGSYKFIPNAMISAPGIVNFDKCTYSVWCKDPNMSYKIVFCDGTSKVAFGESDGFLCSCGNNLQNKFTKNNWKNSDWNHVVVVRDGSTYKMYINGEAETQSVGEDYWNHSASTITVGGREENSAMWNGNISDFRIYSTALDATDVAELYKLGRN